MRRQFVLDKKSSRIFAPMEASLEEIESDPRFVKMMEKSAADIRARRVHTQEALVQRLAKKRK
jgi:hypothetical protein